LNIDEGRNNFISHETTALDINIQPIGSVVEQHTSETSRIENCRLLIILS